MILLRQAFLQSASDLKSLPTEIELVKFETETGRKERLNKWTESYKETADLPWNKFKMYLRKYLGWNRFWNRVISFLHKIIWFINRYIS